MKRLVLLGATGSIGSQTIDVVNQHPEKFSFVAFGLGYQLHKIDELLSKHRVKYLAVASNDGLASYQKKYPDTTFYVGESGLKEMLNIVSYDLLVNALVGARGLLPTLQAIQTSHDVALANKESLVVGGELVKEALATHKKNLYPIDSEHSAIFQCLQGSQKNEVDKLIITASGGSFRDKTRDELLHVTAKEALNHPNWSMGKRITIDSATMMNKGFEVIEAHYLFDIPYDKIDVVMHRQSIVHSLVEFQDGALLAELGDADMRVPIAYALDYPNRLQLRVEKKFSLLDYPNLQFEELSFERFPLLKIAYEVGRKKGNLGAVLNAADEEAVALFLEDKISFLDIEKTIEKALAHIPFIQYPSVEEIMDTDHETRVFVKELWRV